MPELDGFITAKEAEQRYNISRSWLIRKHKEGKIIARMVGPIWLFNAASIEEWMADRPRRGGDRRSAKRHQQPGPDPGPDMPLLALGAFA